MSLLVQLFRLRSELPTSIAERVHAWQALPAIAGDTPLAEMRMVVLDAETSGLDPRRDRLLSIGAVVVEGMRLAPRYTFSAVLRNDTASSKENILMHGLTPSAQAAGEPPEEALAELLAFIGKSPCVAFHAMFDQLVLGRAVRQTLGVRLPNPWVELAQLAPAVVPEAGLPQAGLDDWLAYFRLRAHVRHNAVHDAQVAAELFLILLARTAARGISMFSQLEAAAHAQVGNSTGA